MDKTKLLPTKEEKLIVEGLCQLTKQNTKDALDLLTTLKNIPKEIAK